MLSAVVLSAQVEESDGTLDANNELEKENPASGPTVERVAYMPKGFDTDKLVDTDLVSFGFGVDSYNEELPQLSIGEVDPHHPHSNFI